jgi:prepilin-type N-terminal cleavage/methylation domain-containing protein
MKRQGFTLVEMLVAMALTLFIMVILSQAFITGLDSFSQLKGIGDMEENLRVATNNLRYDLTQDHFEGKRRLSDPTFLAAVPRQGFFRVYQKTPPFFEGADLDDPNPPNNSPGLDPTQDPPTNPIHMLHFTIKLRGNRRENFLSATVPPNVPAGNSPLLGLQTNFFAQPTDALYQNNNGNLFYSQWAEVFYFVVLNGKTTEPAQGYTQGTKLFNLYRAQFVVAPRNDQVNAQNAQTAGSLISSYTNVACTAYFLNNDNTQPPYLYFYTPGDLAQQPPGVPPSSIPPAVGTTVQPRTIDPKSLDPIGNTIVRGWDPSNTTAGGPYPYTVQASSLGTLVSSNVLHFTVQMLTRSAAGVTDTEFNTDQRDYDTAASLNYQVVALQITLRVWDQKTRQCRQISIIQDM